VNVQTFTRPVPLAAMALLLVAVSGQRPIAAPEIPNDDVTVRHVLNRLTFGPRPGEVARVQQIGLDRWIRDQLTSTTVAQAELEQRLDSFKTLHLDSGAIARDYVIPARQARRARQRAGADANAAGPMQGNSPGGARPNAIATGERLVIEELSSAKLLRAVESDRQLEEVLVDFWFNHFNVFASKGRVPMFITTYERDAIRPHVLGRFRDLLGATAASPAMLFYLDNWLSRAPDTASAAAQRSLRQTAGAGVANRSRAGGLNENYGRELLELHTLGVDGGYTQRDVVEVARAFTGWTIDPRTQRFRFAPALHDNSAKVVLGETIPENGGVRDGERVLDIVAAHPATARHVALKLARRFVSDDPPAALVARASQRFRDTGGDLREVMLAIVTSPEFTAAGAVRSKVKTPFEFVVSAVRALDARVNNPRPLLRALRELGMPLYLCQPPTGYADTADAWVSAGALVSRMNVALDLASPGNRAVVPPSVSGSVASVRAALVSEALGGQAAADTLAIIDRATSTPQAVALVIGSPEFQRR
jgi:uncharacterized protein (DUF1800 family)